MTNSLFQEEIDMICKDKTDSELIAIASEIMKRVKNRTPHTDTQEFIEKNLQHTNNDKDFIQMKDMYAIYKKTVSFTLLKKKEKRIQNYKWFLNEISYNPALNHLYRERYQFKDKNGSRVMRRNVIIGYKIREEFNDNKPPSA